MASQYFKKLVHGLLHLSTVLILLLLPNFANSWQLRLNGHYLLSFVPSGLNVVFWEQSIPLAQL